MTKKSNVGTLKLKENLISQSGDDIECKCIKTHEIGKRKIHEWLIEAMAIKCITRLFIAAVLLLFRFAANHVKHVPLIYECVRPHGMFICELVVSSLHHQRNERRWVSGHFYRCAICHFVDLVFRSPEPPSPLRLNRKQQEC